MRYDRIDPLGSWPRVLDLQDRMNRLKLAKKAEAKPKQIMVNVGSEKTLEAKPVGKAA